MFRLGSCDVQGLAVEAPIWTPKRPNDLALSMTCLLFPGSGVEALPNPVLGAHIY